MKNAAALAELDELTTRLRDGADALERRLHDLEADTYGRLRPKRGALAGAQAGQHEARRPRPHRQPLGERADQTAASRDHSRSGPKSLLLAAGAA